MSIGHNQGEMSRPIHIQGKPYIIHHEINLVIRLDLLHILMHNMKSQLYNKYEPLGFDLNVGTPLGEIMIMNSVCRDFLICFDKTELKAILLLLPLREFDVILGMD